MELQYKKLYTYLKQEIYAQKYEPGDLLPSENELCKQYSLAKSTVRQALDELVKEGLIYKHHGKGSVVTEKRPGLSLLSVKGFSEIVGETHQVASVVLDKTQMAVWPKPFFYPLSEIELKKGCFYLKRLRLADEKPVMLEHTYIPKWIDQPILDDEFINQSLFETLNQKYHITILEVVQDIRAIAANSEVTQLLQMPENTPTLHIYRKYITNKPSFNLYSSLYCNTENFAFSNRFT